MDNGGTVKEGVGRTYTGVDGYCPLAAYLCSHGFCLELALRPGVQHSASETQFNFDRVIPMAQRLSALGPNAPILLREDSGFDAVVQMRAIEAYNRGGLPQVDFLIKWNPCGTDGPRWPRNAMSTPHAMGASPCGQAHDGVGTAGVEGIERQVRRVLLLVERTIDAGGQHLIQPQYVLEGWTTTLGAERFSAADIIALYADHGTHVQFHSEFKTDLDLEPPALGQVRYQLRGASWQRWR